MGVRQEGGGSGNRGVEEGDDGVVRLMVSTNLGSWAVGVHQMLRARVRQEAGGRWCVCVWAGTPDWREGPASGHRLLTGPRTAGEWVEGWRRDGGFQWAASGLDGGRGIPQRVLIAARPPNVGTCPLSHAVWYVCSHH